MNTCVVKQINTFVVEVTYANEILCFCQNIAWLKQQYGLSNRRLATILGVGEESLRKLLRGELPPRMKVDVIFRLVRFFDYRPSDLFTPLYEQEQA